MICKPADIQAAINYYTRCIEDLRQQSFLFENCSDLLDLLDQDLYDTQVERYKSKIKDLMTRINSLQNELDRYKELAKSINSVYGVNSDKEDKHEN